MDTKQQLFAKMLVARRVLTATAARLDIENPNIMAKVMGGNSYDTLNVRLYFTGNSAGYGRVKVTAWIWRESIQFDVYSDDEECGFGEISGTLLLKNIVLAEDWYEAADRSVNEVFNVKDEVENTVRNGRLPNG